MPNENNFQHDELSRKSPGERLTTAELPGGALPESPAWFDSMAGCGTRLAGAGVRAVLLLHGSIHGSDVFGMQRLDEVGGLKRGYSRGVSGVDALLAAMREGGNGIPALAGGYKIPLSNDDGTRKMVDVPLFIQNERLGIIQGRWTHINRNYNALTEAISIGIDVHFLIEQAGRYAAGCFQNFNGSGGIFRTRALLQAGGWQSDTLAEDLDASYRVQLQGYQILYLRDLYCPAEVPPTVPSFKKQQGRWACGSLQTAKKLLPMILPNRNFGIKQRLEAFIHLTGYLVHPLMFTSFVLACLATFLRVDILRLGTIVARLSSAVTGDVSGMPGSLSPRYLMWSLAGLLIVLCTIAAWIPPMVALRAQPLPLTRKLSSFGILFFLGCGISLNNTIVAGKALLTRRNWAFKRTPKYAVQSGKEQWRDKRYQVSLDFECFLELVFVCLGVISIGYAILNSNYGVLAILTPFTAAYAFVFSLTILQSRQEQRA